MDDRWQQIERIFHAARELDGTARAEFLATSCAGDDGLLQEVKRLLSNADRAASFLETPAAEMAAGAMAREKQMPDTQKPALEIGAMIAHYRLTAKIGEGGMGEVYRARDTKLRRDVALKILPQAMARDAERMARFEREAQVLASLNHPNIAAIYGLDESNGVRALVMEMVEGETLEEKIVGERSALPREGKALRYEEALPIARQIAEALEYAHERGVIHRDLKPANVKITPEGTVKVLDFGLAKVLDVQDSTATVDAVDSPTLSAMATETGMILGTAAYMSPEQARGQRVDRRADIWAFGCVLFEMLTGRKAFEGETISDMLAAVLTKEPNWAALPGSTPEEIPKVIRRCLQKDVRQRLQAIGDARIAIEEIISGVGERSALPSDSAVQREPKGLPYRALPWVAAVVKRHRGKVAVVAALVTATIIAGGYFGYRALRQGAARQLTASTASANMQITQLTSSGTATLAAISPDGRYVAYVEEDHEGQGLWLRQIATGSNVQIIPPTLGPQYSGLTFTPDGDYLDYVEARKIGSRNDLYRVPVLGGQSTKVLENVDSAVTYSPGRNRIAFLRFPAGRTEPQLVTTNPDGSSEKVLKIKALPSTALSNSSGIAWSPDGKVIAASALTNAPTSLVHPVAIDVSTGEERNIGPKHWFYTFDLTWLPGSRGLLMIGSVFSSQDRYQIWQVSYPDGKATRITNDLNSYSGVSVTADGGALATIQSQQVSNIWVAPKGDWDHPRQVTQGLSNGDGRNGLSWTGDGKIVYTSSVNGNTSLWQVHPGNGQSRRIIQTELADDFPSACGGSPGYITFLKGSQKNNPVIWRVNPDGSHLKQLTDGRDWFPSCSPDGKWVVYWSESAGKDELWKVSIDGGNPVQLTSAAAALLPSISRDGKWVACFYQVNANSPWTLAILPLSGGKPVKTFQLAPSTPVGSWFSPLQWMSDGRAITYLVQNGEVSNIAAQPIDGGALRQLTHYASDHIFWFDMSHDGQLALARGNLWSDVVLIRDFR